MVSLFPVFLGKRKEGCCKNFSICSSPRFLCLSYPVYEFRDISQIGILFQLLVGAFPAPGLHVIAGTEIVLLTHDILKQHLERLKALQERRDEEQARLLEELRLKYERELAEQEKAIEEKYEKIEEERIFSIVTEEAVKSIAPAKKSTTKATSKKASTGKSAARKTSSNKKK